MNLVDRDLAQWSLFALDLHYFASGEVNNLGVADPLAVQFLLAPEKEFEQTGQLGRAAFCVLSLQERAVQLAGNLKRKTK